MANSIIPASPNEPHPSSLRGHIDAIGAGVGIMGWAADAAQPARTLKLELVAGDVVLADCETDQPRADVADLFGSLFSSAGFTFPPTVFAEAAALVAEHSTARVLVRIAGTNCCLPYPNDFPTVAEFASFARAREVLAETAKRFGDTDQSTPLDMAVAMENLRAAATPLKDLPLRPLSENLLGFIESVSFDLSGAVWITGWIKRGQPAVFSAVIADRRKFTAGVVMTYYDRDDLPPGATAMIAAMKTDWRPESDSEVFLYFGEGAVRFHLRAVKPLRIITGEQLVAEFERVRAICRGQHTVALQRMLIEPSNWIPDTARVAGFAVEACGDRVLAVPGFGCFVEGWILSPVKRVASLFLKLGSTVLVCDNRSLYYKARRDLLSAFPNSGTMIDRAGFIGVFLGPLSSDEMNDPILKIVFSDGSSTNHVLDSKNVRRLAVSAELDDVLGFYPAIEAEWFFSDLATAIEREATKETGALLSYMVMRAPKVIVFAVPTDRSDALLLFENVFEKLLESEEQPGFIFIAERQGHRSDIIAAFNGLRTALPGKFSLYFVDSARAGFQLLPQILAEVGAHTFVYVGNAVFLTDAGWAAGIKILAEAEGGLTLFEIQNWMSENVLGDDAMTADCFSWTTVAFNVWLERENAKQSGTPPQISLYRAGARNAMLKNAGRRSRPRAGGIVLDRMQRATAEKSARRPAAKRRQAKKNALSDVQGSEV